MESSTDTGLSAALAEIREIDGALDELGAREKELKKKREYLEKIAIEAMQEQGLDGVKVAGRSWRVEWTHSFSATEATREALIEAAREAGILDDITTINTTRLKALLTERAKDAGLEPQERYSAGTEFDGVVGEYVAPRLRHVKVD